MGVPENVNTELLLSELGGCGRFQFILGALLNVTFLPSLFSFLIETFGTYNPGWKCLDNTTSSLNHTLMSSAQSSSSSSPSSSSSAALMMTTTVSEGISIVNMTNRTHGIPSPDDKMWTEYGIYSCSAYESCQNVEFSPDASTIVSEWGLTCNKGWILSTMLSVRMAGYLFSTLIVGYIGDRFGRKLPYIISRFILVALNLVSFFSVSWEMYTVASFAMGFIGSYGLLAGVTMAEYVSPEWRIKIQSLPTWSLVSMAFAAVAMVISDWRMLRLITTISGAVLFLPAVIWMPESLRWISIKGEKEKLMSLITRIAKTNNRPVPSDELIQALAEKNQLESKKPVYTIFHLFRKGYRIPTIVIGFIFFATDVIYFAFHFGIAALPGNFFTNLMIFSATDLPANLIAFGFASRFRRKPTVVGMQFASTVGILGIVALDLTGTGDLKVYGIMALVMVIKLLIYIGWVVLCTSILELYPTVIRSTVNGFAFFCSSLGGIISPYLVPSDPETFFICYLAMAILTFLCGCFMLLIPETKDKPLKDTWDLDDQDNNVSNDVAMDDIAESKQPLKKEKSLVV